MTSLPPAPASLPKKAVTGFAAAVAVLAGVEVASGVLQGFYTPIFPQLADHLNITDGDLNWFEAAQLMLSALAVPLLARLADLWGHKKVLLLATAVTALSTWATVFASDFWTFLFAWAFQGAYVVWLPIEVAIIYRLTADSGRQGQLTRRAAAILVGVLEVSVVVAALSAGALVEVLPMPAMLAIPAVITTICLLLIQLTLREIPAEGGRSLDLPGFGLLTTALLLALVGLMVIRLDGPTSLLAWGLVAAGAVALWALVKHSLRRDDPMIDVRLLSTPAQWPIQLTAFLFGFSVLGAQIPLSTFAQSDPDVVGYGLGADPGFVSILIGVYVLTMAVGAFTLPLWSRLLGARNALILAAVAVALGYGAFLLFNTELWQVLVNMAIAGFGSGMLVAALPAAAAAAAPATHTGFATGMTNATKTVGGSIASAIFAIALSSTGSLEGTTGVHATLGGYLTVWGVCSAAAVLAAASLLLAPKHVFEADGSPETARDGMPAV